MGIGFYDPTPEQERERERERERDSRSKPLPQISRSAHPFLDSRAKPSHQQTIFYADLNREEDCQLVHLTDNRDRSIHMMKPVLGPHGDKPGVWLGCTWFSAEVVDRIWALLHPTTLANLQKMSAQLESAIFDQPAPSTPAAAAPEIVTKLPRTPRPRAKKVKPNE